MLFSELRGVGWRSGGVDCHCGRSGVAGDVVAKTTYQNDATGQYQQAAYVYYASVPIDSGKQVLAVQLPVTGTSPAAGMHIFGVAVS
jgi:hypothetical protein